MKSVSKYCEPFISRHTYSQFIHVIWLQMYLHLYMYLHISWKRQVKLHHLKKPFHTAIIFSQINHQWKLLWQGRELIKKRTFENWENYKRQQNSCINLSQKMKHDYFTNLHVKNKSDSKSFCSKSQFHNISRNILNSNIH